MTYACPAWELAADTYLLKYSVASSVFLHNPSARTPTENIACIVDEVCLPRRCLTTDILLSRALAYAEICLPSRCLAMGIHVTIYYARIKLKI
jgi:hypothetical protein